MIKYIYVWMYMNVYVYINSWKIIHCSARIAESLISNYALTLIIPWKS